MLLSVFLHLVHDETKSAVDDLLIKFQLSLLLVEVLYGALDFDRIEVEKLVLLLEHFEKTLNLYTLMQDEVLNISGCSDLLLVAFFLLLHLCLNFVNVLIVSSDSLLCLLLFFCNCFFDFLLLPSCLSNLFVKLSYSCIVVIVLIFLKLNDRFLLGDGTFKVNILLLVNHASHALHFSNVHGGGLEPLYIRVLSNIHVAVVNPDCIVHFLVYFCQAILVIFQKLELSDHLISFLGQQVRIE